MKLHVFCLLLLSKSIHSLFVPSNSGIKPNFSQRAGGAQPLRGGSHIDALRMLSALDLKKDLQGLFRRKEYEFCKEDEAIFNATTVVMRHVAKGFAVHGAIGFVDACKTVYEDGLVGIRKFTGCFDELAYAIFIHHSASAFESICATEGSDMENLMDAMESQRKLWVKMRIPLIIKTILLAVQMVRFLLGYRAKK